jgi:hypothetical protein
MLNRRMFLGGLSASLPLLAMPGAGIAQGRTPRLHVMIVGMNTYAGLDGLGQPIQNLKGCQNDAAGIEAQVKRFKPATLTRLGWDATANEERVVTRAIFIRTWEQTLAAAQRGDTLLLTYAGHGSRIAAADTSSEADGRDDVLVLTRWKASDERNRAEHIIDDELRVMFDAAAAKGVIVVFVADSCHSGTLTRALDPLAGGGRTFRYAPEAPRQPRGLKSVNREAPAPGSRPELPPNMVFFAGALETQVVPEIADSAGQHHGALSMAFAQALGGEAVTADGVITVRSLQQFVLQRARLLSEGVQNPRRRPTRVARVGEGITDETRLFVPVSDTPVAEPPRPSSHAVRLYINGRSRADAAGIVRHLRGAVLADTEDGATLVWHAAQKVVLNGQGHRVAEKVGENDLQGAIDCRAGLNRVVDLAASSGLNVQVLINGQDTPASDASHKPGDNLAVRVTGLTDGEYLAVFNFTGTGEVQMLLPTPYHTDNPTVANFTGANFNTGVQVYDTTRSVPDIHVGEPFGADHVIAVAGRRPLTRLMAALKASNAQLATTDVVNALATEKTAEGQTVKIGLRGIYTARA